MTEEYQLYGSLLVVATSRPHVLVLWLWGIVSFLPCFDFYLPMLYYSAWFYFRCASIFILQWLASFPWCFDFYFAVVGFISAVLWFLFCSGWLHFRGASIFILQWLVSFPWCFVFYFWLLVPACFVLERTLNLVANEFCMGCVWWCNTVVNKLFFAEH